MLRRQFVILSAAAAASAGACSAKPATPADAPDGPPGGRPNPSALYTWTNAHIPASAKIGWAVQSLQDGGTAGQNPTRAYLMQSVFKLWVAACLLDKVDRGEMKLDDPMVVTQADLGYPYQPVAEKVGEGDYHTTLLDLIRYIVILSDNPSAEILLKHAGGPTAVTAWLKSKRINGIRIDGGERMLHAQAAEIDAAEGAHQAELVDKFVGATLDGATPNSSTPGAAVDALAKLYRGELLSPASTKLLISIMGETATGETQLKAGLEPGWRIAHKTGNGGHANHTTRTLGLNDIGLLTAPDGQVFAVAIFIAGADEPKAVQDGWMADLARGVVADWKKHRADSAAASD